MNVKTKLIIMIKMNNTKPIVKSTSRWVPEAYPISETIPVVKKRTELNGKGTFTEFPATSKIAIASPIALPTPRTIAETIPDLALGKTTLKIVCILLAPSANELLR